MRMEIVIKLLKPENLTLTLDSDLQNYGESLI